ncbi:MAG: hypothetical protein JJE52_16595 [Acidimicrobiia bacterium]|nr:hypothetical protein [Acidimicrobiia bacterium]
MSLLASRSGRTLGVALIVVAAALAVAIVFASGDDGTDDGNANGGGDRSSTDTAAESELPAAIDAGGGLRLVPRAAVPGATTLSAVADELRLTDTARGVRYAVDRRTFESPAPVAYSALSRIERSVPDPATGQRWVAEETRLHRLDDTGAVVDTISLEVPGAIHSVADGAVWLTVSGVPEAHQSGTARSYLQRVDTATGEVISVPLDDPATFRFALGSGAAWVTVGRTVHRLDATTLEATGEVPLDEPASSLVVHDGVVMVTATTSPPHLVRFAADTLEPLATIDLGAGAIGDAAVVAGPGGDELWVLRPDDDAIVRVHLADGSTAEVGVPAPLRIEVDDEGVAWVLAGGDDTVVHQVE